MHVFFTECNLILNSVFIRKEKLRLTMCSQIHEHIASLLCSIIPFRRSVPSFRSIVPFRRSVPLFRSVVPFRRSVPSFRSVVPFRRSVPGFKDSRKRPCFGNFLKCPQQWESDDKGTVPRQSEERALETFLRAL